MATKAGKRRNRQRRIELTGPRWARLRRFVLQRDGYRCKRCGKAGRLDCDHVKPLWAGGAKWDADNCQALCRGCHIRKTALENRIRYGVRPRPQRKAWDRMIGEL